MSVPTYYILKLDSLTPDFYNEPLIDSLDEETFGSLFYFFQFSCYISCLINGVNPFDQEGVESYKKDMFRLLGKWK